MAKRTSLREFQEYLTRRLTGVAAAKTLSSFLAVQAGDESSRWLLPLSDAGEVVSIPALACVPLTKKAFLGLANIRGNLYAVTDFPAFLGKEATPLNSPAARLLLVGTRHGNNVALLVSRLLGLRRPEDLTEMPLPADAPVWAGAAYQDAQGNDWRLLDVAKLLQDPYFMDIVL
ncbi:MAG: chemotaxis protein CheW [Zoogloeaceae bacterium]|jgi:twitching motility protein PilI|nr:chemotaxis protein CheW [Zoogloeaceae bacterium]